MKRLKRRSSASESAGAAQRKQAARILRLRTRHQMTDVFVGSYASAFRGDGLEYSESRPYIPGDNIRDLDWNATARSGVPHIKQFKQERGRRLLLVIETSANMAFGTHGQRKIDAACAAAALLAAAAIQAGDRVGLLTHHSGGVDELPPARGEPQLQRLLIRLVWCREHAHDCVDAADLVSPLSRSTDPGSIVCHFSDFRSAPGGPPLRTGARTPRRRSGERVSVLCSDQRELEMPEAGLFSATAGPRERSTWLFDTRRPGVRDRFEEAAAARVAGVARHVRSRGDDFIHFRTERDPLRMWLEFFRSRGEPRFPAS